MDFGERFLCSDNNNSAYHFDPHPKSCGSGLCKSKSKSKTPSVSASAEWRDLKAAKITQDGFSKAMLLQHQQRSNNMLSFSSPRPNTLTLPYYAPNTTGYESRGSVCVRGPFTPSQWMELEHQALIYKYITVNAPIPSNLLIPMRKALETAAAAAYPASYLRHTAYGWGGFHLGFSNSSDPEPGRCRRTDGKKWRCSRDAVADQKYCERHLNRGRHRSRKPVEGQTGHSVSNGPPTTTTTAATVVSHSHPTFSHDDRSILNKENKDGSSSSISVSIPTTSEFGFVCSDSLLNPLRKTDDGIQKSQNSLRQFMDDWPHSEKTISIPSSDLTSSTSSPIAISERLNHSPLRMGLGVGNWIPVSWESSMGGPLGEVLHHNNSPSASALNLMTTDDGWESSQQMSLSSPTAKDDHVWLCFK